LHAAEGAGVVGGVAVGLAVGAGCHVQVTLVDLVGDAACGVVVVAGGVREGPGVGGGAGVGARRAAQVQVTLVDRPDGADRARRRVAGGVVGHAVGGDRNRDVGLGDAVADGARG